VKPAPKALSVPVRAGLVRDYGAARDVLEFQGAMVEFFVEAADLLGVPKSVAAIYGTCFASATPLSFSDIEQRLDISKGSISQGLRVLRDMGALRAVGKPDDRRETFEPDLELRKLVSRWIEQRLRKQLTGGQNRLRALDKLIPARDAATADVLRERLASLQSWHGRARALLPIAKTFLKLT
jgi:DNA-binding transcriptional regulator GbsR (MarR family)